MILPALLLSLGAPGAGPVPPPVDVRLVVVITVDQLRGDYLARWAPLYTGALRRFNTKGAVFPNARQDHAMTETAPGHATILSGRPPASTGIVSNVKGVPDAEAPLVEGPDGVPGASPRRFNGSTLADWLLAKDPQTRILSVSKKDRGAILPIGRQKTNVYWWARGMFTTSTWYRDSLPPWVRQWNGRWTAGAEQLAGGAWTPLLARDKYAAPDTVPYPVGRRDVAFPHAYPGDGLNLSAFAEAFPLMDSLTLDFALAGVRELKLGKRAKPDLLAVSLSTTDAIGHAFGPDSRELQDMVLRVDLWLGRFLDQLEGIVGKDKLVVVLTGDHGVQSFPEVPRAAGRSGGRAWPTSVLAEAQQALTTRLGRPVALDFENGLLMTDVAALKTAGIDTDSLAAALAAGIAADSAVSLVFTPKTLAAAPASDEQARLWRRTIPPAQGWLVAANAKLGWIWASRPGGTTHGTTNVPDMNVPVAFLGKWITPAVHQRIVTTEDIAPTLATLLAADPSEELAGKPIPEVLPK
ncbi:MAG: alkaline phosphatase family protein [Gemmatimonadales bacterium]|nr:alkaline phosphatase family protein [Gemmatimonadales bacterium]